jgi:predicted aldo/keto reductase-like oxidoreductase
MSSYSHVEEYVAASGKPLDRAALGLISSYQEQTRDIYCRVSCTACLSACPNQVAVNDVLRFAMYYENYGMERQAMDCYAELAAGQKPVGCETCDGPCERACPFGLKVKARLLHSHDILSA